MTRATPRRNGLAYSDQWRSFRSRFMNVKKKGAGSGGTAKSAHQFTRTRSLDMLFFCRFRRAWCEFLEARIIPQRIEHWIEPEQRGS